MPPLTTEQQTAYDSIDQLLNNVNIKSTSDANTGGGILAGTNRTSGSARQSLTQRVNRAVDEITEINKKDNPQPADIKRRDA